VTADELADEEWGPVKGKGKKGKKKGKKGKADEDDEDDGFAKEAEVEEPAGDLEAKKPVEVTAEELADEEWGPVKEKKGKKGKKGKKVDEEDEGIRICI
jgi:translation initiation factor 5B